MSSAFSSGKEEWVTPVDGGPAFPQLDKSYVIEEVTTYTNKQGVTMRDYFAAKAMQSLLHPTFAESFLAKSDKTGIDIQELVARAAYAYADIMLVERDKKVPQ